MDSIGTGRKQKTPRGGYPEGIRVETGSNLEVQTGDTASGNRSGGVQMVNTSSLLEWILERENMIKAYEQVVGNKGSHGIDKMTVDQLKPYLKENWGQIRHSEKINRPMRTLLRF